MFEKEIFKYGMSLREYQAKIFGGSDILESRLYETMSLLV